MCTVPTGHKYKQNGWDNKGTASNEQKLDEYNIPQKGDKWKASLLENKQVNTKKTKTINEQSTYAEFTKLDKIYS